MIPRHSLELLELRIAPAGIVVDAIDIAVDHAAGTSAAATVLGPDFAPDDLVAAPLAAPTLDAGSFSLFDLTLDAPVANALVANIASIIGANAVGSFSADLGLANLAGDTLSTDLLSLSAPAPSGDLAFGIGSVIIVESSGITGGSPEALLIVNL